MATVVERASWLGWKSGEQASARVESKTADTARGFVEYGWQGSGKVVLVIHGSSGGYDQGLLLLRPLLELGYSIICPSRPGYLRTPIGGGLTPSEQSHLMASLLDLLGIENVAVVGISQGGPCAIEFCLNYPERTRGLVLLSAVTGRYIWEPRTYGAFLSKLYDNDASSQLVSALAHYAPSILVKALIDAKGRFEPATVDYLAEQILLQPGKIRHVAEYVNTMLPAGRRQRGTDNDLLQLAGLQELALERLSCPALIVHGTNDRDVPCAYATYASSRIRRSELILVELGFQLLQLSVHADMIWDRLQQFLIRCGPAISCRK
jgi:pimeloyl-ACP methyl ester carboxylesterase